MGGTIFHAFVKFEKKKLQGLPSFTSLLLSTATTNIMNKKIQKIVLYLFVKLGIGQPSPMDRLTIRQIQI